MMAKVLSKTHKSILVIVIVLLSCAMIVPIYGSQNSQGASPQVISDTPVSGFPNLNGIATASLAKSDGSIFVGGLMSGVGGTAHLGYAAIDGTTGADKNYPGKSQSEDIRAYASDGNGGWYIGGEFDTFGANPKSNLAHILQDGTFDQNFNAGTDGAVYALYYNVASTTLFMSGDFTSIDGATSVNRQKAGAINTNTNEVTDFNPEPNDKFYRFEYDSSTNTIYTCGDFAMVNTSTTSTYRNHIAAFDATTGQVTSFDPATNSFTYKIVIDPTNNTLYATGSFNEVNITTTQVTRNYVAAFDLSTGVVKAFNPDIDSNVYELAYDANSNNIYLTGDFENVNVGSTNVARSGLASFDGTTGTVKSFNPNFGDKGRVTIVTVNKTDHVIYVGGHFHFVDDNGVKIARTNVAAFDIATDELTNFDPIIQNSDGLSKLIYDEVGNTLMLDAGFVGIGGTRRNGIAHFLADGTLDPIFNPDLDGQPAAMLADEATNTLYLTGQFQTANTTSQNPIARNNILALDLTTGEVKNFDVSLEADNNSVIMGLALDRNTNTLYISGRFSNLNTNTTTITRNNVAAVDATTGQVKSSFTADTDDIVFGLALDESTNTLYVGGDYTSINGINRNYLGAVDATTGTVKSFNPDTDDVVRRLVLNNNMLYVIGDFTKIYNSTSPIARNSFASFDLSDNSLGTFNPDVNGPGYSLTIDPSDGSAFIGGQFTNVNIGTSGEAHFGVAKVDSTSGTVLPFNPPFYGFPINIATDATNGRLFITGYFFDDEAMTEFSSGMIVFGSELETTATTTTSTPTTTGTTTASTLPVTTATPINTQLNYATTTLEVSGKVNGLLPTTGTNSTEYFLFVIAILSVGSILFFTSKKYRFTNRI